MFKNIYLVFVMGATASLLCTALNRNERNILVYQDKDKQDHIVLRIITTENKHYSLDNNKINASLVMQLFSFLSLYYDSNFEYPTPSCNNSTMEMNCFKFYTNY